MLPNRSSGRKRWNLHDGPQGSLRRLRNQLAEDGCADSQVVLAKQLLEEKCELEADKVSNFKQALEWLVCATEQGHSEARRMLRRCVRSGVIDEESAAIVRAKSCLKASRQETVARKAARDLFASLSNGEQYITTAQLERRIREICSVTLKRDEREEDSDTVDDDSPGADRCAGAQLERAHALQAAAAAGDCTRNGELTQGQGDEGDEEYPEGRSPNNEIHNLTIEHLVSAASHYCQGALPLVSHALTLTDPALKALDHIPPLHRAFLHPLLFLHILYLKLLYYFGNFSFRLSNVELCLILVGYLSFNMDSISHCVPLVLYYVSFVAMVICTFKMLHAKRQFVDFRKWSGLFLRYSDGNLQPDESESLFVRNNLAPFVQFFVALLINLFVYPFISPQWVPFSEFCVLSFVLMFLTIFSFTTNGSPYPDILALISFAINVLAKYPYEKDTVVHQGWRFLDLHIQNYPSYILGNSIEFCLNARVFFSLLIPIILVAMTRRGNWRGFMKYTLPHCVTLSWLQMFITCSHGCTTYGLIRGTLGLVCSFLFLPLLGIVTLSLPVCGCVQYVSLSREACACVCVLGLASGLVVSCVLARLDSTKKFVTPAQLTMGFITLLYFGNQLIAHLEAGLPPGLIDLVPDDKSGLKSLLKNEFAYEESYHISWEDYYSQCHAPAWAETNVAGTQIKCAVLDGAEVHWEGYVKHVRIASVTNAWSAVARWLPAPLQEYYRCLVGAEYSTLCSERGGLCSEQGGLCSGQEGLLARDREFVVAQARRGGKSCHLEHLNEYTYELLITMEASGSLLKRHADIRLSLDHRFANFTSALRPDDRVLFRGVLLNTDHYAIGSEAVSVRVYELGCVECRLARGRAGAKPGGARVTDLVKTVVNDCVVSAKYVLNFMLNPVVVFK